MVAAGKGLRLAVNDTVKIVQEISLISKGNFEESQDWAVIRDEIHSAVEIKEGFLAVFVNAFISSIKLIDLIQWYGDNSNATRTPPFTKA